ncbi:hypothetical protein HNV12_06160 [Methanococcoides sp. SA1]|nr:hypothetical protein [Methanococcoides sp. SA1]
MKITIDTNATNSGNTLMLRDAQTELFQYLDADSISFADSKNISATTASTPYSGNPMPVVIDNAVDDAALVVEIMLVSITYRLPLPVG